MTKDEYGDYLLEIDDLPDKFGKYMGLVIKPGQHCEKDKVVRVEVADSRADVRKAAVLWIHKDGKGEAA